MHVEVDMSVDIQIDSSELSNKRKKCIYLITYTDIHMYIRIDRYIEGQTDNSINDYHLKWRNAYTKCNKIYR